MIVLTPVLTKAAWNYPTTTATDHTDDYFGTKAADPYRWLEGVYSPESN